MPSTYIGCLLHDICNVNRVLLACRALHAWQGSNRQAGSAIIIISSVKLGQLGRIKVHSAAMPPCNPAAAVCRLMPSQDLISLLAAG